MESWRYCSNRVGCREATALSSDPIPTLAVHRRPATAACATRDFGRSPANGQPATDTVRYFFAAPTRSTGSTSRTAKSVRCAPSQHDLITGSGARPLGIAETSPGKKNTGVDVGYGKQDLVELDARQMLVSCHAQQ